MVKGEIKSCTPMWREADFEVNILKASLFRTTFGRGADQNVHTAVAGSTCRSERVQSAPRSEHFWKLRWRKSARRSGEKHVMKSKCSKHRGVEKVHAVVARSTCPS